MPWRREWQPTPVFLPGKSHEQRNWWATIHEVTESDTAERRSLYCYSIVFLIYLLRRLKLSNKFFESIEEVT